MPILVRDARPGDHAAIVAYNAALALETEHKTLDTVVLSRGVTRALADPQRLRYWVAEDCETGRVVGQAAVTREWSDWRDGDIWWLQSVFVDAEHRGCGVFRSLLQTIRAAARATPSVIGLRLYVEAANHRAQATYRALGMVPEGYEVYGDLWIGQEVPLDDAAG
jgi:GNAT superfamily N-acetyltransferase